MESFWKFIRWRNVFKLVLYGLCKFKSLQFLYDYQSISWKRMEQRIFIRCKYYAIQTRWYAQFYLYHMWTGSTTPNLINLLTTIFSLDDGRSFNDRMHCTRPNALGKMFDVFINNNLSNKFSAVTYSVQSCTVQYVRLYCFK